VWALRRGPSETAGPRLLLGSTYSDVPAAAELSRLQRGDALWVSAFGDLGLIREKWPVIGPLPSWRREDWPVPMFGRKELLTGRLLGVTYPDERLDALPREVEIPRDQFEALPEDGLAGAEFVRLRLKRLLNHA
jgi:hypothetical protein